MLVELEHGMCVNPEIVKLVHVRADRTPAGGATYTVVLKTDQDGFLVLATYDDRDEAEKLAFDCADRVNKASGAEVQPDPKRPGETN